MNILVLNGSPRQNGTTRKMVDAMVRGLRRGGITLMWSMCAG